MTPRSLIESACLLSLAASGPGYFCGGRSWDAAAWISVASRVEPGYFCGEDPGMQPHQCTGSTIIYNALRALIFDSKVTYRSRVSLVECGQWTRILLWGRSWDSAAWVLVASRVEPGYFCGEDPGMQPHQCTGSTIIYNALRALIFDSKDVYFYGRIFNSPHKKRIEKSLARFANICRAVALSIKIWFFEIL